jgi:signal transduction histidine kinase
VGFVSRSLRLKVSLGVSLALILLLAPFNWLQYQLQRRAAIADLNQLAVTTGAVAEHSLEGAMLTNNRPAIQNIVDSVAQAPDVRAVYLLNLQATIAVSPGGALNGQPLDRAATVCQGCHRFSPASRPRSIVVTAADGQPVFRTMTPIVNRPACVGCHSSQDRLNGVLYVDFSMAGLNDRLARGLWTALLTSVAIIVLSALAIYALLSWLVITPMERVARAMRRFSRGERTARAVVLAQDEAGLLGGGFNEMAETIQAQEARAEQLYAELEAKDALRRQLLGRLTAAREEERRYFAREIHDELGQLLTGLSLNLKLCQQAMPRDPAAAADHLVRANALIGETIEQSHRLIADLRPTVLDDFGLIPALQEELDQRLAPAGIAAHLAADGDATGLPPDIATAAFRIAQEAITNVIRHANARRVHVQVGRTASGLALTIEDDGVGLPAEPFGHGASGRQAFGILGMRERAEALGGRLEVTRREPSGARVALWLPTAEIIGNNRHSERVDLEPLVTV